MARRRTKKDDPREFIPTPDRQLEHKSGWCMTGHHDGCKYQFSHGKCGCDCHTKTKTTKTQKIKKETAIIADSDDPRPWKRNNE